MGIQVVDSHGNEERKIVTGPEVSHGRVTN